MSKEAMKLAKEWFERNTYGDEAVDVYEALCEALAEQPAQDVSLIDEGKIALDKMAENARELGLDYEPIQCPICKAEDSPYPKCGCVTYVEQPAQQEPVAFYVYKPVLPRGNLGNVSDGDLPWVYDQDPSSGFSARMLVAPVTSPPAQRTWVGLTNNELQPIADEYRILFGSWVEDFARAIEAKLRSKNNG